MCMGERAKKSPFFYVEYTQIGNLCIRNLRMRRKKLCKPSYAYMGMLRRQRNVFCIPSEKSVEPSEKPVLGLVEKTSVPRSKPTCFSGLAAAAMAQQQRQPWQQGQALWWAALAPASAAAAVAGSRATCSRQGGQGGSQ